MARIDKSNLQGLVVNLYRYPVSRHLMFKVVDAGRARQFINALVPSVTTAAEDLSVRPEPLINVGISWRGLLALEVVGRLGSQASAEDAFPSEFKTVPPDGMVGDWHGLLAPEDLH